MQARAQTDSRRLLKERERKPERTNGCRWIPAAEVLRAPPGRVSRFLRLPQTGLPRRPRRLVATSPLPIDARRVPVLPPENIEERFPFAERFHARQASWPRL